MIRHMEEVWKDIIGWEGFYQISNLGRVKSLARVVNGRHNKPNSKVDRIMATCPNPNGYDSLCLRNNYYIKCVRVHRLIAIHFIPNPNNYPCINHINSVRNDNRIENLEWCTMKQNVAHAFKYGYMRNPSGAECKMSIPVVQITKNGKYVAEYPNARIAAEHIGCKGGSIWSACVGNRKSCWGFVWKYKRDYDKEIH